MEAHSLPRSGGFQLPRSRRLLAALSDERLVDQVRRGNDAAFETIYDRHHRALLSFCRHMLASQQEAEDALQQTFASAYDSLRVGERDIKLKPWLFTIARNRCLSLLRARHEEPSELEEVPTAGLPGEVQRRSDLRDLLADIRELPDDQRAALVLSELGDLSHTDVAAVVGCEPAKVKSLVFQARSSLLETRKARETPCAEIREQIANLRGGALRRGTLRRHIKHCPGCAEFREDVRRQRAMIGALLPVVPSVGLKHSALAAAGIGGGGGTAAGGAAGGGLAGVLGSGASAAKVAGMIAAAGIAVGGGVAVTRAIEASSAAPAAGGHGAAHSAAHHGNAAARGRAGASAHAHGSGGAVSITDGAGGGHAYGRGHSVAPGHEHGSRGEHNGVQPTGNAYGYYGAPYSDAPGQGATTPPGQTKSHTNSGNHNGTAGTAPGQQGSHGNPHPISPGTTGGGSSMDNGHGHLPQAGGAAGGTGATGGGQGASSGSQGQANGALRGNLAPSGSKNGTAGLIPDQTVEPAP